MTNGRDVFEKALDILEDLASRNVIKISKKSASQVEELHTLVQAMNI